MPVSAISLGTVKLGRTLGVRYPEPFELPSDADARALLDAAQGLGINLIDTAPAYGSSEERLGTLLAGRRDRWLLSTKVGEEFEKGVSRHDFSPAHTRASVERSLRRLRTDVLDIVLIHAGATDERIVRDLGTLETLADLRSRGLVRAIGLSAKTPAGARAAMSLADVLMLTLNEEETEMLPLVREAHCAGVGVLVKKALRAGHTGDAGGAIRFCLREAGVSSVVIGTISPAHLRANAAAVGA